MRLWRQPDFAKLWAGQTISLLGSQVTSLALAWTAAVLLQATPAEMGVIGSLNVLPFVLFGLPAGLWVDRVRRRPVLIATDIGRATLLATVPLAAVAGWLGMHQLYAVSFRHGCSDRPVQGRLRLVSSVSGQPSGPRRRKCQACTGRGRGPRRRTRPGGWDDPAAERAAGHPRRLRVVPRVGGVARCDSRRQEAKDPGRRR